MQTEMSSSPIGGLCLPTGKHAGILTYIQTQSQQKNDQKSTFFVILSRSDLISVRPGVYFLFLELIQTVAAL